MTIQKHAVPIGLPTVIWNIILSFLAFCDVLNLLYSHRNFCYIIDESTFKVYFHNKDSICSELAWRMFLKRNFEVLIKEVKHIFVYVNPAKKLHNNYRDYLFFNERVFSVEVQKSLSLYSIFMYFVFVSAVVILRVNIIARYVQKFQFNLMTTKFFLKKF